MRVAYFFRVIIMKKIFYFFFFVSNLVYATPTVLNVAYKNITVNGKVARVGTITQADGTWGYYAKVGDIFDIVVKNKLSEPTVIHWHGLLLPNDQDGTELTQAFIKPGNEYHYKFRLTQSGTFWMHSHYGLQEQELVAAPLIIESAEDKNYQQVVVMFQDFTFLTPKQVLAQLKKPKMSSMNSMAMSGMKNINNGKSGDAMNMSDMKSMDNVKPGKQVSMSSIKNMNNIEPDKHMKMPSMKERGTPSADLNDVKYDAFLTNYHSDANPEVVYVKPGDKVKLRLINGSAMTNFWVNLGAVHGSVVATDSNKIIPYQSNLVQLGIAQRMDVVLTMPKTPITLPVLGQVEGTKYQTGIILTNVKNPSKMVIPGKAIKADPALNYDQELKLQARQALPKWKIDRIVNLELDGDMKNYTWMINKQIWPNVTPIEIKQGERVELVLHNNTMMAHPMHLHGNVFQVVNINGNEIKGALRDTVLVLPNSTVKVVFDANAKGKWFLHCHMLYHMHVGMATFIEVK